ncbi:MAG: hypothetical protein ACOY3I_00475 [Verrucomicrobiota bacterium]
MNTQEQSHPVHKDQATADAVMAQHFVEGAIARAERQMEVVEQYDAIVASRAKALKEGNFFGDKDIEKAKLASDMVKRDRAERFGKIYNQQAEDTVHAVEARRVADEAIKCADAEMETGWSDHCDQRVKEGEIALRSAQDRSEISRHSDTVSVFTLERDRSERRERYLNQQAETAALKALKLERAAGIRAMPQFRITNGNGTPVSKVQHTV